MESNKSRGGTKSQNIPDRPEPSHLPEAHASSNLHTNEVRDKPKSTLGSRFRKSEPRKGPLDAVADHVREIIASAETLFKEAQNQPTSTKARERWQRNIDRNVNSARRHWDNAREGIRSYMVGQPSSGERPVEWVRGWYQLTHRTRFNELIQHTICALACEWKCELQCRVSYPSDLQTEKVRHLGRANSPIVRVKLSRPPANGFNPSRTITTRATGRSTKLPKRPTESRPRKQSTPVGSAPIEGCAVTAKPGGIVQHGEVVGASGSGDNILVDVAWGRDRKVSYHMPQELESGFQPGDTVQDVPRSNNRNTLGTGTVMYTTTRAGEEQVAVEFNESGQVRLVPFHRLRRVVDVKHRFVNHSTSGEEDAERLRLKCLAYSLESWNEQSGALDRLPVEPLPHQINIVHRIMTSDQANWLIADDVGLGKTIEIGLLLAAKKRRRRRNRVLIVCPAALTKQWQDEMKGKFEEDFLIYGDDFNINQPGQWTTVDKVIVSVDKAKSAYHLTKFQDAGDWDTVVFDEAHHLSKRQNVATTQRYRLAEKLRDKTDEFLFLTGTPHQGDTGQFVNLLALLRPDLRRRLAKVDEDPSVVAEVVLKNQKRTATDNEGNLVFQGQETYRPKAPVSNAMKAFSSQMAQYLASGYAASESGGHKGALSGSS